MAHYMSYPAIAAALWLWPGRDAAAFAAAYILWIAAGLAEARAAAKSGNVQ
jgi:hypothetical protein